MTKNLENNMNIYLLTLLTIISINLNAHDKWIKIEALNDNKTKTKTKIEPKFIDSLNSNLTQILPFNKILRNKALVEKILIATKKEKKKPASSKKWFTLKSYHKQ
jgi:nitrogenase subunit NifH